MSLVICSNDTKEQNALIGQQQSIYKPWSWTNDLSSTLELPAHCQVALQSAKIKMDGTITIGEGAKTFLWWFGKSIDDNLVTEPNYYAADLDLTTSVPIKVELFSGQEGLINVSIADLASEVETALNKACLHPNLHGRITCEPTYDATNQFTGFQFVFGESAGAPYLPTINALPASVLPGAAGQATEVLDGYIPSQRLHQLGIGGTVPPYTVTAGVDFNTMAMPALTQRFPQSVMLNIPPLHLKSGKAAFSLTPSLPAAAPKGGSANPARIACGISRPTVIPQTAPPRGFIRPSWYKLRNGIAAPSWMNYYDFGMFCNFLEDQPDRVGSKDKLTLFHTVRFDQDDGGHPRSQSADWQRRGKVQIFKYGDGTGGSVNTGCDAAVVGSAGFSADHGYDLVQNALNIAGIYWKAEGQQISVVIYDKTLADATHTEYILVSYDATRIKPLNLKPIDQGCWCLQPQVTIWNNGAVGGNQALVFEEFNGTESSWPNYDLENNDETSWELQMFRKEGRARDSLNLFSRTPLDYDTGIAAVSPYLYDGLVALTLLFSRQKQALITGPDARYPGTFDASMAPIFGFGDRPTVNYSTTVLGEYWQVTSPVRPDIEPSSSIFVRLHGFNQQSVNAKARGKSDIIAHLPRFDGTNSYGPLFLEPSNMVYLDLKNPSPIKVNSFDISLCHSDETYATGLIGTTIVVLHFRKDPSAPRE